MKRTLIKKTLIPDGNGITADGFTKMGPSIVDGISKMNPSIADGITKM